MKIITLLKHVFRQITELVKSLFHQKPTDNVDPVVSNETPCYKTHTFRETVNSAKFYSRCSNRRKPTIKFPKSQTHKTYSSPHIVETEYIVYHGPNIQYDESEETVIRRNRLRKRFRSIEKNKFKTPDVTISTRDINSCKTNLNDFESLDFELKHRNMSKVESAINIEGSDITTYSDADKCMFDTNKIAYDHTNTSFDRYEKLRNSIIANDSVAFDDSTWSACQMYYYPLHVLAEIYDFVPTTDGKHFECKLKCTTAERTAFLSKIKPRCVMYDAIHHAINHMKELFIRCEYVIERGGEAIFAG